MKALKRIVRTGSVLCILCTACMAAPSTEPTAQTTTHGGTSAATTITGTEAEPISGVPPAPDKTAGVDAKPGVVTPNATVLKGEPDPSASTATGLRPLPARAVAIDDAANSKGLPTKKIEHSYGAASNGEVHSISRENQAFFDQKGYAAAAYDNKSTEKALYLTFDCGYENGNTAIILDVLKEKEVPAAFFCTVDEMRGAPEIVARMINEGHIVGNHSVKHPHFSAINRTEMAKEILEADNYLRQNFGYSAPFFRFPFGEYTESALDAAASLGFTSVFWSAAYKDWETDRQQGAEYACDMVTGRLHPGAILLLHSVSGDNAQAMGRIIDKARTDGYTFRHLTSLPIFDS